MEIWKDIYGYEGHYQVSNLGNVKALYREFTGKDGQLKKYPERILKPELLGTGSLKYKRVSLSKDHKVKRYFVHVLVAQTYIHNPEHKPYVNHIDNDGLNNKASNLEWVTHSENMLHAQTQGRLAESQSKGGKAIGAKLKADLLSRIAESKGESYGDYLLLELREYKPKRTSVLLECVKCKSQVVRDYKYVVSCKPRHKCKVKI